MFLMTSFQDRQPHNHDPHTMRSMTRASSRTNGKPSMTADPNRRET